MLSVQEKLTELKALRAQIEDMVQNLRKADIHLTQNEKIIDALRLVNREIDENIKGILLDQLLVGKIVFKG